MDSINLTPARAEVLRAVAAGEVKHHRNWGRDPVEDKWRPAGSVSKRVTATVNFLRDAGLIKVGPAEHASMYAPQPWLLTEAGERWLADNDGGADLAT